MLMTTSNSSPSPMTLLRHTRRTLLDLVFPPRCAGCGRRGGWFCHSCLSQLMPLAPPWCQHCGRPLPDGQWRCRFCQQGDLPALDWARAAYPHSGAIRKAIHRFKYAGEQARAESLAALLAPLLLQAPAGDNPPRVAPVPLSAARQRARGYNQAAELARVLTRANGWPLDTGLVRVRATPPQVGLDRAARQENVRGAFAWRGEALFGQRVLLVDDVMTTGATANECAATMKAAGALWIGLVTVARAL
ncbi:MAG: ComF family protein [Thermomicrobiales bacterium]